MVHRFRDRLQQTIETPRWFAVSLIVLPTIDIHVNEWKRDFLTFALPTSSRNQTKSMSFVHVANPCGQTTFTLGLKNVLHQFRNRRSLFLPAVQTTRIIKLPSSFELFVVGRLLLYFSQFKARTLQWGEGLVFIFKRSSNHHKLVIGKWPPSRFHSTRKSAAFR